MQTEKISRVVRVVPTELANFNNLNTKAKPTNLILTQEKIFAADATQKTIYSLDLKSQLVTAINLTGQNFSRLDFPSLDKTGNISYFNLNNIIIFDTKTENISALGIDFPTGQQKIINSKQYNNRYYLTDALSGQIYRFNKSGSKLTGAAPWLNGQENLTDVTGLDIDGNIYLLKNNGEISIYSKGKKQNFSISTVEPNLSQAAKLTVSQEQDFLYVFEPAGKRLVVFDKKGKFINQYTSDNFNNLKDFQVDEKNKKIYFLAGAVVYAIDMINAK